MQLSQNHYKASREEYSQIECSQPELDESLSQSTDEQYQYSKGVLRQVHQKRDTDEENDIKFHDNDEARTQSTSDQPRNHFEMEDIPQNFGNCIIFNKNSLIKQPMFTLGPDWPLFTCTWIGFTVASFFLILFVGNHSEDVIWTIITTFVCSLQVVSYLITALFNPGIAHKNDIENLNLLCSGALERKEIAKIFCKECNILKDQKTAHCTDCNVCIRGFDHHCPWTGKCIGQGNILPFYIFVSMTFVLLMYSIIIIACLTSVRVKSQLNNQN